MVPTSLSSLSLCPLSLALALTACNRDDADHDSLLVTMTFQQGISAYQGATDSANHAPDSTCQAGADKSCRLRWALPGLPRDASITSASITLHVVEPSTASYSVRQVDRHTVVGSVSGAAGSNTIPLNAAGLAMVQSWVRSGTQDGVVIASDANPDDIAFASSTSTTPRQRPLLSITYTTRSARDSGADRAPSSAAQLSWHQR
jgi:hypothetical protein